MKFKELSQLSTQDLKLKIEELKKDLIKLNAQVSTGTAIKNPGQIKKSKKDNCKNIDYTQLKK